MQVLVSLLYFTPCSYWSRSFFSYFCRAAASSLTQASRFFCGRSLGQTFEERPSRRQCPGRAASCVPGLLHRMDANRFDVGIEAISLRGWHAVLADEDHQIGAHEGVGREAGRESMIVGEMSAHRTRGHDRDVVLLGRHHQRLPGFVEKYALPGHDHRTLGPIDQVDCLRHVLGRGMRPRLGAVFVLAVIVLQLPIRVNRCVSTSPGKSRCTGPGTPVFRLRNA